MKYLPVHKNLDTAFVNLSALIRYLRRRQFVGSVRVELDNYEGDIVLTAECQIRAREYDRTAGRVAEGDDALERLLIRAREPGGIINVYRAADEDEAANAAENNRVFREDFAAAAKAATSAVENRFRTQTNSNEKTPLAENRLQSGTRRPEIPFDFSKNIAGRVGKKDVSAEEWQTLLDLTGELLKTIDDGLAKANLVFSSAFEKARIEISDDYPFLNPISGVFTYKNGRILMEEQVNAAQFSAGINETLKRILGKLGQISKFADVYRSIVQEILALIRARKSLYDKFSITPQLEKTLGA